MPFKGLLARLIASVPGSVGAILVDWEGEAVDQVGLMDDYDLKVIGAHKGLILHNLREVVDRLGGGRLGEIVVTTTRAQVLVVPVTDEYCLVLMLDRPDRLGRARFEAQRCALLLHEEFN